MALTPPDSKPAQYSKPALHLKPALSRFSLAPEATGLYNPRNERDACGLAMVATLRGTAGHDIIDAALGALRNLEHRGAIGSDAGTGDGAGIVTQVPDDFFRAVTGFTLPPVGRYVVGMAFLPTDDDTRAKVKAGIEQLAGEENLTLLGWREVPVRDNEVGKLARAAMPAFEQLFLSSDRTSASGAPVSGIELDRQSFRLRKRAERALEVYFPSLSSRTVVFKGMVTTLQLEPFYPDLSDERFTSKLALVHSRYSTHTFPSWPLAQPFRMVSTPFRATATGCAHANRSSNPNSSATSRRSCRSTPQGRATPLPSTRSSNSSTSAVAPCRTR